MASYLFQCEGGFVGSGEPNAVELAGVREAQIEAAQFVGEMLQMRAERFWDHEEGRVIVSDEKGLILFTLDVAAIRAPTMHGATPGTARSR